MQPTSANNEPRPVAGTGRGQLAGISLGRLPVGRDLRPSEITTLRETRANHRSAAAAGAGRCLGSTMSVTAPSRPRCTAWCTTVPRPSSLRTKPSAPTSESSQLTSSTSSLNAAPSPTPFCGCAAVTTSGSPIASSISTFDNEQRATRDQFGGVNMLIDIPSRARGRRGPTQSHSITSSACSNSDCGIVSLNALALFRFTAISNRAGSCTGNSAGLAPLTMRATYQAERRNWARRSVP